MADSSPPPPPLEQIRIASPCPVSWDSMHGDNRSRLCGECKRQVYNSAALTRAEAEALIVEKEGDFCGRFYRRADGTVLTADCPVGVTTLRRRLRNACVATFLLGATLLAGALQACGLRQTARSLRESGAMTRLRESVQPQTFFALGAVAVPACSPPVISAPPSNGSAS